MRRREAVTVLPRFAVYDVQITKSVNNRSHTGTPNKSGRIASGRFYFAVPNRQITDHCTGNTSKQAHITSILNFQMADRLTAPDESTAEIRIDRAVAAVISNGCPLLIIQINIRCQLIPCTAEKLFVELSALTLCAISASSAPSEIRYGSSFVPFPPANASATVPSHSF